MNKLIDRYLEHIREEKNLSLNTIDAYRRDIERFEKYLSVNNETLEKASNMNIMSYTQNLTDSGRKDSSIARSIICIRNFYKFLMKIGYTDIASIADYEIPKFERNIPQVLTVDEINLLLSSPDTSTCKGIRDKAMLEMMYATGIKVSEMLDIKITDINLEFNYIRCQGSKGISRVIPLGKYSIEWLEKYLKYRKGLTQNGNEYLFLNNKGERLTRQGFWKVVKYYAKLANINKDINLYTIRHSIAVHLIENGADLKSLKELMGYKDISAVQIYLDIIHRDKLMEVYKNAHPRA